jgi:hypothetical protein
MVILYRRATGQHQKATHGKPCVTAQGLAGDAGRGGHTAIFHQFTRLGEPGVE